MTLADIALYANTHLAHEADLDLAHFPAVRDWVERIAALRGMSEWTGVQVTSRLEGCPMTVRVQREDFDLGEEVRRMTAGRIDVGAVATFTGVCRGVTGTPRSVP